MGQIYYYHLKVITASSEERKKRNLIHKQTRWLVNTRHYKFDLEMMYFTVVQNYEDRFFFSNVTISSKLVTSDKHQFLLHFLTVISNLGDITVYVISMDWFLFALQHEKKYSGLLYHFKTFLTFNIGNLHPYILKSWIQIDWWIFNQFFFPPPFKRMISVILLLAYFIVVYLWPCGVASIAILCLLWWYKAGVLILSGFIFCLYLLCIKMYFMIDSTFNYFFFFFDSTNTYCIVMSFIAWIDITRSLLFFFDLQLCYMFWKFCTLVLIFVTKHFEEKLHPMKIILCLPGTMTTNRAKIYLLKWNDIKKKFFRIQSVSDHVISWWFFLCVIYLTCTCLLAG